MSKLDSMAWQPRLSALMPGFIVSTVVAAAACFLSEHMVRQ